MLLVLLHPRLSQVSCQDCIRYLYRADWTRVEKGGRPVPRNGSTPCKVCPKIPAGAKPEPASAVELDDAGWRAYGHYLEMKAVGFRVPDVADPVVRRNAALIRAAEDEAAAVLERRRLLELLTAVGRKAGS